MRSEKNVEEKRIKILFFIDTLKSGGKERQLVELLKGLSTRKNFLLGLVLLDEEIHYKEVLDLQLKINYLKKKSKIDLLMGIHLFKIIKSFFILFFISDNYWMINDKVV